MNCGKFLSILPGYFDAKLPEALEKEFVEHMQVCSQCNISYSRMKQYFEKVKELPDVIPIPKQAQDELIKKLQLELGTSEKTGTIQEKPQRRVVVNQTAELGKVETVHRKRTLYAGNPFSKSIIIFFIAVLLVLAGVYAFLVLFKKH